MSFVTIVSNVVGPFTIDSEGIRSDEPVPLESATWDSENQVLKLEGSKCGMGNYIGSNSQIIINGYVITSNSQNSTPKKSYSDSWKALGLTNPKLSGMQISGPGSYRVSIPLDDDCTLALNGSGNIKILGDHQSNVSTLLNGSGSIKGKGTVNRITATLNGSGSIEGFQVVQKIMAMLSGSGSIKLQMHPGCKKQETKNGPGKISIK